MSLTLFDKRINVFFTRKDGTRVTIATPVTGRKPTIRVSGRFVSQDIMQQVELRLTNFATKVPLADYQSTVDIEAGYAGGIVTAFSGQITNAFQELPGPDGITTFQLIIGNMDNWLDGVVNVNYPAGTLFSSIFGEMARVAKMNPKNYVDPALTLADKFSWQGPIKDGLPKLRDMTGVVLQPWGKDLVCFQDERGGTGVTHVLNVISNAKHSAAGFEVVAPWVPNLMPGDTLLIDPKYFRQDFGGANVQASGNRFQVYMVDFDFETTGRTNTMTVLTVGAA